jgi:hypothetical protein
VERDSEAEWNYTPPHRAARERATRLLSTLGAQPRWLTPELVAAGVLRRTDQKGGGLRVLVLPEVSSMSDGEAAEIRAFAARGGTVLMMGMPGRTDGRSRLLPRPQLADLAPARAIARLPDDDAAALPALAALLARTGAAPLLRIAAPSGAPEPGIETRVLANGQVRLAGLRRHALEGSADIVLTLPSGHVAYDLRRGGRLADADGRVALRLQGAEQVLLAIAPARLPAPTIVAPPSRAGEVVELRLALAGPTPADATALRVDVTAPDGSAVARYSGNIVLRGAATWHLPLAASDPPGLWRVRATDVLSGISESVVMPVGQ